MTVFSTDSFISPAYSVPILPAILSRVKCDFLGRSSLFVCAFYLELLVACVLGICFGPCRPFGWGLEVLVHV